MEMAHVRYFLALCSERNFTRAARRCGVSQPSLTRAIKVLERELGGPLFRRLPGGLELTELGAELKPHFRAISRSVDDIQRSRQPVSMVKGELLKDVGCAPG